MNLQHQLSGTLEESELKEIISVHFQKLYNCKPTKIEFEVVDIEETEGEEEQFLTTIEFNPKDASKLLLDKIKPIKEAKPTKKNKTDGK